MVSWSANTDWEGTGGPIAVRIPTYKDSVGEALRRAFVPEPLDAADDLDRLLARLA